MIKKYFLFLAAITFVQTATAISVDWTGGYRIEYTDIDNPTLTTPGGKKNYATQYLYLAPKIIASDGINIVSRFDIMGSDVAAYRNSQQGVFFGGGVSGATGQNATAQNSDATQLRVSQLYIDVQHEFGELIAGRAPIQFGMGITHNAGLGEFDHWNDNRDLALYRFKVDNIYFMPIFAKIKQNNFEVGKTVAEQSYVLEYDNKDIGAKTGVFYQTRTSSDQSNDMLASGIPSATSVTGGISLKTINIFLERRWPSFEMRLEGSFLTGSTGLSNAANEQINVDSYAVVSEMLFPRREDSKWEFGAKLGAVSGDDPTTSKYEGYQLDRNYDVAMLLFNHRMGAAAADFLTTGITRSGSGTTVANSADEEALGNAMFVSPHFKYAFDEKIDLKTAFTYAQLMANPGNYTDFKKDLGFEVDLEVIYKPRERVSWSTGMGFLAPGNAFKGGTNNFDNKANWGFSTKAAITF